MFISDSRAHGQMITWADYAGSKSRLVLRVVAINAWRAQKTNFKADGLFI